MKILLIGDKIHTTEKIKLLVDEKIGKKIDKLLSHLSPDLKIATIRIEKIKLGQFKVNFDMTLPGKEHLYSQTTHLKLKSALIDLQQQVEKQIKKYKQFQVNYSLS